MTPQQRYQQAYYNYKMQHHREVYERSGCYKAKMPKLDTANGLSEFIVNFINWNMKGNVTKIQTQGRFIQEKNSQGHKIEGTGKWIKGTTKRGTADIIGSLNKITINIEVKIGKDRPSIFQLKMQQQKRLVGEIYEFVSTPEEFLLIYDKIVNND